MHIIHPIIFKWVWSVLFIYLLRRNKRTLWQLRAIEWKLNPISNHQNRCQCIKWIVGGLIKFDFLRTMIHLPPVSNYWLGFIYLFQYGINVGQNKYMHKSFIQSWLQKFMVPIIPPLQFSMKTNYLPIDTTDLYSCLVTYNTFSNERDSKSFELNLLRK